MLISRLNAQAHSALLDWIQGDLNPATQTARRTISELSQAGMPFLPQGVCAYLALAGVATDRGELDAAHQWLDLARGAAIEPHVILALAVMRARCGVLQADLRNDATMPMARLRRAAVKWLRAHGRPDEAVRLAITGGDWSAAASIVVNDLAIARLLVRPGGQVDAVLPPASPRTRANPQVGVARAAAAVAASDFGAAKAHLARVRRDVKWQGTSYQPAIELCTAVVEIALANAQENWADVLAGVDEVEKMLAEQAPIRRTRVSELHAFILWQKGVALLWSADDMVAGAACLRSAAVAADSANFVPVGMNCLGLLALLEILEGNPQRAERLATTAARMAQQLDREDEFHPAAVEVALAWAKAQQSDLPAAQRHADRASTSLPECPDRIAAAVLAVVNARLQVRQHHACSGNARSASDSRALSEPLPSWLKARLISARDHFFAPAVARVRGISRLPHVDGIHPRMNGVADGLAKSAAAPAMTGRSAGRAAGATDHVPAPSWPGKSHNQEIAALEPAIIEPLTDREMEVLEKLSAHYSTEEIAEAMFISVNTVRTHVRNISRKLSAPRRQQAVRVARRLQLIA
jgi:LuxR family transcriptional regulator, maltose regulon positive regulatory protein